MAQQSQETIPIDSGSFPPKRKRGRPRKYDDLGSEPRRRYLHSTPNLIRGGSGQRPQVVTIQPTPTASLGIGSQSFPVQFSPTTPISGNQVISTQGNSTSVAGYIPQSLPFNPNFADSSNSGPMPIQMQTISTRTPSAVPYSVHTEASHTAGISLKYPRAKQPASSSHDRQSLVGQAVCGVLDGTFDAGYLLTVRVGSTGEVLKGLVFDPRLCVPISEKNDIAPLLPVASTRGLIVEAIRSDLPAVPTPVTVKEPVVPSKSIDEPVSEIKTVSSADKTATQDACHSSQADIQVEAFQTQTQEASSLDHVSQQPVMYNKESERPSSPPVAIKVSSIAPMAATGKLTETLGIDGFQEQNVESSMVDSSGGYQQNLQQIQKQTEKVIKELEDQKKNSAEEKSSER